MDIPTFSAELQAFALPTGWFLAAYLLGSIPEAWLLTRWTTGQDLRRIGSGNVGVMNTALSVNRRTGLLVFAIEICKGVLAVAVPQFFDAGELIAGLGVVGVVAGVRWPVWLGFKGGRGNTAGMAAFVLISWLAAAATAALWFLFHRLFHNSFKASRAIILSFPLVVWVVTHSGYYLLAGLALSAIYLSAHRQGSDDHLLIKQRWVSLRNFLSGK